MTVFSRRVEKYPNEDERDGIRHIRVSTRFDERVIRFVRRFEHRVRRIFGKGIDIFYKRFYFTRAYYLLYAIRIARLAKRNKLDALVVTNFSQFIPILRLFCRRTKLALIMQCDWLVEMSPRTAGSRIKKADAILGCSHYIASGIAERFPDLAKRCHALYNASSRETLQRGSTTDLDRSAFAQSPDDKIVVFIGRVTPEKGIHVLINAMPRVLESVESCTLLIVGGFGLNPPQAGRWNRSGPNGDAFEGLKADYEGYLTSLAMPLGDRVRFTGDLPHTELAAYYRLGDVFVHPSLWNEPFGMTLTEAMVCERPVVSTRTGGIPEIVVEGETGYLVEPDDTGALADRIVRILKDDQLRAAMGQAGRRRVEENFSWENTANGLVRILEGASRE